MIRASFGKTVARSMLIGGLALLAVPAVAGCEAGENAPTLEFHHAAGGAYDMSTAIHVSNAFVLGAPSGKALPAGGSASLFLGMFNTGASDDKLVSASAQNPKTGQPIASSVQIQGGGVTLPAGASTNLTGPRPSLVLRNLTQQLQNGQTVQVVLDFQSAGPVKLDAPVEAQAFDYATYSPPAAAASASPTASGAPGAKAKGAGAKASPKAPGAASPTATPTTTPTASPSPTATK